METGHVRTDNSKALRKRKRTGKKKMRKNKKAKESNAASDIGPLKQSLKTLFSEHFAAFSSLSTLRNAATSFL